ncbi:MAG TPA: hypothetical protein VKU19_14905 [Bryobacteraceae bacterium]|nr:hypothetical protein [Bryobacteraceae bacterium]
MTGRWLHQRGIIGAVTEHPLAQAAQMVALSKLHQTRAAGRAKLSPEARRRLELVRQFNALRAGPMER